MPLPVLARRTAGAGRGGLEFFVGIPGSVGGAVRMNAGGHGRETADVLVEADVVDLAAGEAAGPSPGPRPTSRFGYRRSAVGPTEVVTGASFRTTAATAAACEAIVAEIVRWRREHQPGGSNAGSVFANPPGDSAGRLIDSLGLKGLRVGRRGGVATSTPTSSRPRPAPPPTTCTRSWLEVRRRVLDATGIALVPELRMVGFDEDGPGGGDG